MALIRVNATCKVYRGKVRNLSVFGALIGFAIVKRFRLFLAVFMGRRVLLLGIGMYAMVARRLFRCIKFRNRIGLVSVLDAMGSVENCLGNNQ